MLGLSLVRFRFRFRFRVLTNHLGVEEHVICPSRGSFPIAAGRILSKQSCYTYLPRAGGGVRVRKDQ